MFSVRTHRTAVVRGLNFDGDDLAPIINMRPFGTLVQLNKMHTNLESVLNQLESVPEMLQVLQDLGACTLIKRSHEQHTVHWT
jgi:hypothetical protein